MVVLDVVVVRGTDAPASDVSESVIPESVIPESVIPESVMDVDSGVVWALTSRVSRSAQEVRVAKPVSTAMVKTAAYRDRTDPDRIGSLFLTTSPDYGVSRDMRSAVISPSTTG